MNKIITREQKQAPLTHAEMDSNFTSLAGAGNVNFFKDYDLVNPIVFDNIAPNTDFVLVVDGLFVQYAVNGGGGTFVITSGGTAVDALGSIYGTYDLSYSGDRLFNEAEPTLFSYNIAEQKLLLDLSGFEAYFTGSIRYFSNAS